MHDADDALMVGIVKGVTAVGIFSDYFFDTVWRHACVKRHKVDFGCHYGADTLVAHGESAEHDVLFEVFDFPGICAFTYY